MSWIEHLSVSSKARRGCHTNTMSMTERRQLICEYYTRLQHQPK